VKEYTFDEVQAPAEISFEEAQKAPVEMSFEELQALEPKEASWYDTISSIPSRVVEGAKTIIPNFENKQTQEELQRRKFEDRLGPLQQPIGMEFVRNKIWEMAEPTPELEARARTVMSEAEKANADLKAVRPEGESEAQQVVGGAFESLAPGAVGVATVAASRGRALPSAVRSLGVGAGIGSAVGGGYMAEVGGAFNESIERGATVPEAARSGDFAGAVSLAPNFLQLGAASRAGTSILRKIGETAGAGFADEFMTAVLSGYEQKFAWDPSRPQDEIWRDSLMEGFGGIIGGAAMGPIGKVGDVVAGPEGKFSDEQRKVFEDIARTIENGTILTGVPKTLVPYLEQWGTVLTPGEENVASGSPAGAVVLMPWDAKFSDVDITGLADRWETATDNMDSDRADEVLDQFEALTAKDMQAAINQLANAPEEIAAAIMISGRDPMAAIKARALSGEQGPFWLDNFARAYRETIDLATKKIEEAVGLPLQKAAAAQKRLEEIGQQDMSDLKDTSPETAIEIQQIGALLSGISGKKSINQIIKDDAIDVNMPYTSELLRKLKNSTAAVDQIDLATKVIKYLQGRQKGTLLPQYGRYFTQFGAMIDDINNTDWDKVTTASTRLFAKGGSVYLPGSGTVLPVAPSPAGTNAQFLASLPPGAVFLTGNLTPSQIKMIGEWLQVAQKVFGGNQRVVVNGTTIGGNTYATNNTDQDTSLLTLDMKKLSSPMKLMSTLAHEYAHGIAAKYISGNGTLLAAMQNSWWRMVKEHLSDPTKSTRDYERAARGFINPVWDQNIMENIFDSLLASDRTNVTGYVASFIEWLAHQGEKAIESMPELQTPGTKTLVDSVQKMTKDIGKLLPSEAYQLFVESRSSMANKALLEAQKSAMLSIAANLLVNAPKAKQTAMLMERVLAEEVGVPFEEIATENNPAPPGVGQKAASPLAKLAIDWGAPGKPKVNMTAGAKSIGLDLDKFNRFSSKWAGLMQLSWRNPHIASLKDYTEGVMRWANTRMKWMARANDTVKAFHKLGATKIDQLTRLMLDETARGEAYDLTNPGDAAYVKQTYPALDEESREVYDRIRGDFIDFMRGVEEAAAVQIRKRLASDPVAQALEIRELRRKTAEMLSKPYFPMARFGEYMVYLKAAEDTVYEGKLFKAGELMGVFAFEGEKEQQRFSTQLARSQPKHMITSRMATQMERTLMGMNPVLVEAMSKSLQLSPDQRQEMEQFMLKVAPAMSWVKHMMSRKGTLGYSLDGVRAFSDYFLHGSNHLARMMHGDELREAVKGMETEELRASGQPGQPVDSTKRSMIRQWVMDHYEYIMNPQEEWARARAVVAIMYLGGSLRSALVNLTQTATFTYPRLASKFGEAKAVPAILRQYKNVGRLYKMISGMNATEEAILQKFQQNQVLTPHEEKLLSKRLGGDIGNARSVERSVGLMRGLMRAVAEGFLDESNATELAAMSEGGWMTKAQATTRTGYYARASAHALMYAFQEAEKLNRRVAFGAAYELAFDENNDPEIAYQIAKDAVFRTQFEYAKWNRAPMLRGRKGLALMFWQYQLNALSQITSDRSFFWRWALVQTTLAGTLGLPFAENLLDLIDWIMERINPNRKGDTKYEISKILEEYLGFLGSDAVLHGISPLTGIDISGSMSMGRFLPFTDILFGSQGAAHGIANFLPGENAPVMDFKDLVQRAAEDTGGAAISLAFRMLKGITSNDPDKVAVALRMNPISFLRDASEATVMANEGQARSANGVPILEFDLQEPRHSAELIARGFGFQPTALRTGRRDENGELEVGSPGRDLNWLISRQVSYYQTRREMLIAAYAQAYTRDDDERQEIVLGQINSFNEEVGRFGLGIKGSTLRKSLKARAEKEALAKEGLRPGQPLGLSQALRDREF